MGWRCFVVEPSDFCRRSLRRYGTGACDRSGLQYHNTEVVIDPQIPAAIVKEVMTSGQGDFKGDPRWPVHCECGHEFAVEDHWQVCVKRLYVTPDGRLYALQDRDLPVGAMWDADWLPDNYRGPDGKAWCVRFPGGHDWLVFGPSSDGHKWQITGTAPQFTARPSIGLTGVYHGFLNDGVISEDADGRAFADLPRTA
jgi:hypothetical protein